MKILYLTRDDGRDVRGTKMCNSLAALGHDVVFVGWDRSPEKPKGHEIHMVPSIKRRIYGRSTTFGANSLNGWGGYFRHLARVLREERPDVVQAVNEEKAAMALPFKHLYYRDLVIDVYDSVIANRYRNCLFDRAGIACRWISNLAADRIIETSQELQSMLGRHVDKSVIIENAPMDPGEELSQQFPVSGPVRLGLGGALTDERMGLKWLLDAVDVVDAMEPGSVIIEASGRLLDDFAKNVFAKHPCVNYRWLNSPRDFLDASASCDALLYLRTDAHESAYRAAVLPNRVFDALAVGRPLIINSSLHIGDWVRRENLGQVVPDGDVPALTKAIHYCKASRSTLPDTARRLRKLFLSGHTWPVMQDRLKLLYENL